MTHTRRWFGKIHLWLGLLTGPIVMIVALTGALYSFQEEIQDATQPFRFIREQQGIELPPTVLIEAANAVNPGKTVHGVLYSKNGRAATVIYYSDEDNYYEFAYVHPYTGQVQKIYDVKNSFFGWVLSGHFNLWLPRDIGQPIVATSTLVFALILLVGLYLWWPRNKNNRKQKFTIKRRSRWRRRNYDLHSVVGFYALLFGLLFALTGLMWGFNWFKSSVYTAFSGESYTRYYEPKSKPSLPEQTPSIDRVWVEMNQRYPNAEWIEVHIPHDSAHSIAANANPDASTYWKTDYLYFDQQTLETIPVEHEYKERSKAHFADDVLRINYDLHVGSLFGIPGKFLMCLMSLVIASLPITGFIMWYGRRNKKRSDRV